MEIPGLGHVAEDPERDGHVSEPIPIKVLGGGLYRVRVHGYVGDPRPEDFSDAIRNFLDLEPSVLRSAEPYLFAYYDDIRTGTTAPEVEEDFPQINTPAEVWSFLGFIDEVDVERRREGDRGIYISAGGWCDWEDEHGLQVVFKNGLRINKIGPWDGRLTNGGPTHRPDLEDVIFVGFDQL